MLFWSFFSLFKFKFVSFNQGKLKMKIERFCRKINVFGITYSNDFYIIAVDNVDMYEKRHKLYLKSDKTKIFIVCKRGEEATETD